MVIASGVTGDRRALFLGLTRENVERLKVGNPIRLTPETHPGCPDGLEIVICYGLTERAIADELLASDAVTDSTKVIAVARSSEQAH